jgi:diacylglycerol O-acyltransferase / wax synthase
MRACSRDLDRLSSLDVSNLRVEDRGQPMHVAALVVLGPVGGGSRPLTVALLRATIEQRLHRVPRLRQMLYQPPRGLGRPVWTDDPRFDIRQHVWERAVRAPGDEAELLRTCAELNASRLDRARPLWQVWLLTGLAPGRTAVLIRLHHAVADGVAAVSMLGALFDDTAVEGTAVDGTAGTSWTPAPPPTATELAADEVRRCRHAAAATASRLRPATATAGLATLVRQVRQQAHDGLAPRLSLNVPVSGRRRILLVRADLGRVRDIAHAYGGTVNDVLLAAVAGGARALLQARGELAPGLVLKASVAASFRSPAQPVAAGNQVGVLVVPLRLGDADPAPLLSHIAAVTAERKQVPPYRLGKGLALRWQIHVMRHQRLVNLLVSDLPGPTRRLSLAGAPVLELIQVGVVQGNLPLSVGAISYAGQLNIDIVADCDAVPDLDTFAGGVRDVLCQLGVLRAA